MMGLVVRCLSFALLCFALLYWVGQELSAYFRFDHLLVHGWFQGGSDIDIPSRANESMITYVAYILGLRRQ